jgi:transcription initiation factor TFIIIB Brf1 subunit/transcription initiation factor TFIIB
MAYFDHFVLCQSRVHKRNYQLLVGACLLLASKCESSASPGISSSDISFSADNTFSSEDVLEKENVILSALRWKLAIPTIHDFVQLYIRKLGLERRRVAWMMKYLAELALQSPIHESYLPSKVAACVVVLALYCLGSENANVELWSREMEELTGWSWQSLESCLVTLSTLLHDVSTTLPQLSIISRRYRKVTRGSVANVHVPRISSFAALTVSREQHQQIYNSIFLS